MAIKENLDAETSTNRVPSVLMMHAYYKLPGGEDNSFRAEQAVFQRLGFEVSELSVRNAELSLTYWTALSAIFSPKTFWRTMVSILRERPSVIYVNNLWPGLSGSAIFAARLMRVPVLQAVRNYRLVAPSAKLTADGACYVCHGFHHPTSCIIKGCYNGSRLQSLLVAAASWVTKISALGWCNHQYLATSETTKSLLIENGFDPRKISVRANFDLGGIDPNLEGGEGVVVMGRLSAEKGILQVVQAWPVGNPMLTVIGDGPLADELSRLCESRENITWVGHLPVQEAKRRLRESALVIVPSVWAEPFGRVAIEAMSVGTPVACLRGGGLAEVVGTSGVLLDEISEVSLASAVSHLHKNVVDMRRLAYERYTRMYTIEAAVSDMAEHLHKLSARG